MTNLEAKKALSRKLNIDWSDIANNDLFSSEDIQDYINQGVMQAYDYKFWDFAEHSKTATLESTDITNGYVAYPNDILPSSIYYVSINAKEYTKRNFTSFKKLLEDQSTSLDKVWAEYKRLLFFNQNTCSAGHVIDIYGKRGCRTLSNDSDLLPFSPDTDNEEYSGNQACILLAYAEALSSEKKKNPGQAKAEFDKATLILDRLAGQMDQGKASEHSPNKPMFDVPNMFPNRNGGSSSIGTFSN